MRLSHVLGFRGYNNFGHWYRNHFNTATLTGRANYSGASLLVWTGIGLYFTKGKLWGKPAVNADGTEAPPFPEIKSAHSLVAKHVTPEKWAKLGGLSTKTSGFTLGQAIACAVEFDDQHCGIYAGDEDSYAVFADVFDPIIEEYHGLPVVSNIPQTWMPKKLMAISTQQHQFTAPEFVLAEALKDLAFLPVLQRSNDWASKL